MTRGASMRSSCIRLCGGGCCLQPVREVGCEMLGGKAGAPAGRALGWALLSCSDLPTALLPRKAQHCASLASAQ